MSRRKEANRAEAIFLGIAGLIMLLILAVILYALPQILKGKTTGEMMDTMMHTIHGFEILGLVVGVIGLIVWIKVLRSRK